MYFRLYQRPGGSLCCAVPATLGKPKNIPWTEMIVLCCYNPQQSHSFSSHKFIVRKKKKKAKEGENELVSVADLYFLQMTEKCSV